MTKVGIDNTDFGSTVFGLKSALPMPILVSQKSAIGGGLIGRIKWD